MGRCTVKKMDTLYVPVDLLPLALQRREILLQGVRTHTTNSKFSCLFLWPNSPISVLSVNLQWACFFLHQFVIGLNTKSHHNK